MQKFKFLEFWQYLPYYFDPVAFNFGPVEIRWYSLMYVCAILVVTFGFYYLASKNKEKDYLAHIFDFFNFGVLGIIVGARLGYVMFYNAGHYITHPLEIIWPFNNGEFVGISGLSYHGGALGFLIAIYLAAKLYDINFYSLFNRIVLLVPLGYTFGRIGNFLNQELFGRATQSWIGMYFPTDSTNSLRYPSQLFEAVGEGLFLFLILYLVSLNKKLAKYITPIYILGYAVIRYILEYFREPDSFQKLVFGLFSYGQVLSLAMVVLGLCLIPFFKKYVKEN